MTRVTVGVLVPLLCACFSQLASATTVRETLRLTWAEGAPNGRAREMIYTNGQFPGPSLVFNEDDDVEVGSPDSPA